MPFIPDEQEKTVKIPIQVRGGQIHFYFDGPFPLLEEGVIGDLVVPALAVLDPKARKLFSEERKIPLFKKKTLLYVQLRPERRDDAKPFANHLLRPFPKGARLYVELHPETPEGDKSVVAQLQDRSLDMLRVFARIELQDTRYYPFRSSKESGTKPTFQQWLDKRYGGRFVVHEFRTVDARGIPRDILKTVVRHSLDLLENGHTVLVLDSAGAERTARVCEAMGYKSI